MSPNLVEEVATLKESLGQLLEILNDIFGELDELLGLSLASERRKIEELKERVKKS